MLVWQCNFRSEVGHGEIRTRVVLSSSNPLVTAKLRTWPKHGICSDLIVLQAFTMFVPLSLEISTRRGWRVRAQHCRCFNSSTQNLNENQSLCCHWRTLPAFTARHQRSAWYKPSWNRKDTSLGEKKAERLNEWVRSVQSCIGMPGL